MSHDSKNYGKIRKKLRFSQKGNRLFVMMSETWKDEN